MKVLVKEFIANMELKNNGMELQVHSPGGQHLGDLVINKSRLVWCEGRTRLENGVEISWTEFIKYANSLNAPVVKGPAKKVPVKKAAAKKAAAR